MTDLIQLPPPMFNGEVVVEAAIRRRRSHRHFQSQGLSMTHVAQLCWAAQGLTHPGGFRTVPSAGALYPLEIYMVAGRVEDLSAGAYRYRPQGHVLEPSAAGDRRSALCRAALGQTVVQNAALVVVVCAVFQRMTRKYGHRGERYVHMEAGHTGQNIALQCVAMGLGSVMIGAFADEKVGRAIGAPPSEVPLYIIPVGVV